MVLEIYNTLTKSKEEFKPIQEGKVNMYACGPTVNDVPHLGHARAQISFDVLRKYFAFSGYDVKFVSNITDIEDKIINKAHELGIPIAELTEKNAKEHMDDYAAIGIAKPDVQPRATEYVSQMIELVQLLIDKGFAYTIEGDGIYYDVSKFEDYGKLSGIDLTQLKSARELKDESKGQGKRDSKDFVLWKFSKEGEPSWAAVFGDGRPGWHIECSAMTHAIFGKTFDLHCGGQDLIFPHHEDEIAQSEAGYGEKMCNYWMHNGMVNIEKVKMSKSLGNFTTIKKLLEVYSGEVIRYFVLNSHYRKPVDFSTAKLDEAKTAYERLKRKALLIEDDGELNELFIEEFKKEMDEDLNTAGGINVLWKIVDYDGAGRFQALQKIDEIMGFHLLREDKLEIPNGIQSLLDERQKAREDKDWKLSDELRDRIQADGFLVKDGKGGQEISRL
ncbi:MAG: cysteine--tRNA ligase [Nanoarchaeota archaeon]|jgi:cysteinyl-tRNA synthetase|nr:cysteine--tRNA ligase [Nanoarchaeota archaeon]